MATLRIFATLEQKTDKGSKTTEHAPLSFESHDAGLVATLENYWRVVRELAAVRSCVPTLYVCNADRSRSIALRVPPFKSSERGEHERARTIYEALVKLSCACSPESSAHALAARTSGTYERARSLSAAPPQASAERTSGAPPGTSAPPPGGAHERSTRR